MLNVPNPRWSLWKSEEREGYLVRVAECLWNLSPRPELTEKASSLFYMLWPCMLPTYSLQITTLKIQAVFGLEP